MDVTHDAESELACQQNASFEDFLQRCECDGLLSRPTELHARDAVDGLNDKATLLYSARSS